MKLILSTLALGAAATSSALDLGGDSPQASAPVPAPAPTPALDLPQEAPLALVPAQPATPAARPSLTSTSLPPAPLALAAPAAAPTSAAPRPNVELPSSPPTLGSLLQEDDIEKSAKQLEKEIASLRKQLAKMREELRKSGADQETIERAVEMAEKARESARARAGEARVRLRAAESLERGEQAAARGEAARARAESRREGEVERRRARQEGERRAVIERRAGADAQRENIEKRLARVRLLDDAKGDTAEKEVVVLRGRNMPPGVAPRPSGAPVIGVGVGGGARGGSGVGSGPHSGSVQVRVGGAGGQHEVHTIHSSHERDGGHGSTININVEEGDVHIHAGGAQIHTSKGASVHDKSGNRTLFGMVRTPDGKTQEIHKNIIEHVHGDGARVIDLEGGGRWATISGGDGAHVLEWTGEAPQVRTWVSGAKAPKAPKAPKPPKAPKVLKWKKKVKAGDNEDLFFFDGGDGNDFEFEGNVEVDSLFTFDGEDAPKRGRFVIKSDKGGTKTEEFQFPGGSGTFRFEVETDDDDDDGEEKSIRIMINGEQIEIPGGAGGVVLGVPGQALSLSGIEGAYAINGVDVEGLADFHGNYGDVDVEAIMESVDVEAIMESIDLEDIHVDLSEMEFGDVEIHDIEFDDLTEEIHEALEGAFDELEIEEVDGNKVFRGRLIHKEGFSGDGDTFEVEVAPGKNDKKNNQFFIRRKADKGGNEKVEVDSKANPFASSTATTAGFTNAVNNVLAHPASDDQLMDAVRDIQAELKAMRAELAELREAVLAAPRRTARSSGRAGRSTGYTGGGAR